MCVGRPLYLCPRNVPRLSFSRTTLPSVVVCPTLGSRLGLQCTITLTPIPSFPTPPPPLLMCSCKSPDPTTRSPSDSTGPLPDGSELCVLYDLFSLGVQGGFGRGEYINSLTFSFLGSPFLLSLVCLS